MSPRWRLILAAAAFLGWLAYLGYAAAVKSHDPIVSRAQAAAAKYQIVAEVKAGADGKAAAQVAKVVEPLLTEGAPAAGTDIFVSNLPEAKFDGEGRYLLLVIPDPTIRFARTDGPPLPTFAVVGQQRSPGTDLTNVGPPLIYPWTEDVRKQAEKLRR